MSSTPSPPPRGELFRDPGARVVWNAILALPVDQQHLVLEELQSRLAAGIVPGETHETRKARGIQALREAAKMLGASPSVNRFEALRIQHPEYGWPPAGSIRTWFGRVGWNECLKHAHLEALPGADVIVIRNGAAFTKEEMCEALRDCRDELGFVPSLSDYLGWAHRRDVRDRDGRRPSSQGTFDRVFGGYANALVGAGLVSGDADAAAVVRGGIVRAAGYFVSDELIHAALLEIAGLLNRSPRVAEYIRERQRIVDESVAAGAPRSLPSYAVIQRRYGTWDAALEAAGLEPLGGRATRSHERAKRENRAEPQLSDEMIFDGIREAHAALGEPFSSEAYKTWRKDTLAREREHGVFRKLASYHTIWQRFGSWENAKQRALVQQPAAQPDREDQRTDVPQPAAQVGTAGDTAEGEHQENVQQAVGQPALPDDEPFVQAPLAQSQQPGPSSPDAPDPTVT